MIVCTFLCSVLWDERTIAFKNVTLRQCQQFCSKQTKKQNKYYPFAHRHHRHRRLCYCHCALHTQHCWWKLANRCLSYIHQQHTKHSRSMKWDSQKKANKTGGDCAIFWRKWVRERGGKGKKRWKIMENLYDKLAYQTVSSNFKWFWANLYVCSV